jgi:hypothetical protein
MNQSVMFAMPWLLVSLACAIPLHGQERFNPETLLSAQRDAMKRLAFMDGVWRGPAWTILPSGQKHDITQTERIGPFLENTLKVIEGRGYDPEGKVSFNAMGIISFVPDKKAFMMRSYAQGFSGDFELHLNKDGFTWEIPAGPGTTIRYTATVKDGTWREVGDRIVKDKEPIRFFEMNLKRIGDSNWPKEGTIPPK